jgi:hypothetical protein
MYKKITIFAISILLILTLVGCNNSVDPRETNNEENGDTKPEVVEAFHYTYEGTKIPLNSKAQPILDELGEETSYFESESCAFPGLDKVYTYPSIEIQTYEKDGVDHVLSISILDDTIKTGNGVRLFDSPSKIIEAYGENYEEKNGQYIYTKGETMLSFLVKDNEVIAIEYSAIVEASN